MSNYPPREKIHAAVHATATARSEKLGHPVDVMAAYSSAVEFVTSFVEELDARGLVIVERA